MGDDYYGCDCDMCLRIRYEARLAACEALVVELETEANGCNDESVEWPESHPRRATLTLMRDVLDDYAKRFKTAIRGETNDAKR